MSKYEKNHFLSKKIMISLKNRFSRPILHIDIKFHQSQSINKEFHFFRPPLIEIFKIH